MLASSHHYAEIKHFEDHGIELTRSKKEKMVARKPLLTKHQVE
jgi:dihydrolipoamide dehydrogenase